MITTVRYTPAMFGRAVMASFKEKPVNNGLTLGVALALCAVVAGPLGALQALGAIAAVSLVALGVGGLALYILHRGKRKFVPVSYDITGTSLKITFGDRTSLRRTSRKIRLDSVERVWFRSGAIHIKQKGFTYHIVLPQATRSRFIEQMRRHGWFERRVIEPKLRLIGSSANIALYLLIAAMIFAIYPAKPQSDVTTLSNAITRHPLTSNEVLKALNSQRSAFKLGALQPDSSLMAAAASSCQDMTNHTYFGDLSGQTGDVYSHGHYADGWVMEAGAAVRSGTTPDQVVSHWVNSGATSDTVLQTDATRAGASICTYTVNHSHDKIVVVELGS